MAVIFRATPRLHCNNGELFNSKIIFMTSSLSAQERTFSNLFQFHEMAKLIKTNHNKIQGTK